MASALAGARVDNALAKRRPPVRLLGPTKKPRGSREGNDRGGKGAGPRWGQELDAPSSQPQPSPDRSYYWPLAKSVNLAPHGLEKSLRRSHWASSGADRAGRRPGRTAPSRTGNTVWVKPWI
jgi:hypothetical protein